MNVADFSNLKVGDVVIITAPGANKGKQGIVSEIEKVSRLGIAYLKPLNCEFEFPDGANLEARFKNGLYGWYRHWIAQLPKPKVDKLFYISRMYGEEGIEWSTENFNERELKVVEKFLKELNEHIAGIEVDAIAILDND